MPCSVVLLVLFSSVSIFSERSKVRRYYKSFPVFVTAWLSYEDIVRFKVFIT